MSCCIEAAILDALRAIPGTPIRSENHFIEVRECADCVPYLVIKTSENAGLRTSDGVQVIWTVLISAYFDGSKRNMSRNYRDLVRTWLYQYPCVDLGECGCFCLNGQSSLTIRNAEKETALDISFSGSYQQASVSVSD